MNCFPNDDIYLIILSLLGTANYVSFGSRSCHFVFFLVSLSPSYRSKLRFSWEFFHWVLFKRIKLCISKARVAIDGIFFKQFPTQFHNYWVYCIRNSLACCNVMKCYSILWCHALMSNMVLLSLLFLVKNYRFLGNFFIHCHLYAVSMNFRGRSGHRWYFFELFQNFRGNFIIRGCIT